MFLLIAHNKATKELETFHFRVLKNAIHKMDDILKVPDKKRSIITSSKTFLGGVMGAPTLISETHDTGWDCFLLKAPDTCKCKVNLFYKGRDLTVQKISSMRTRIREESGIRKTEFGFVIYSVPKF